MVIPNEILNTPKNAKTKIEKRVKIETEHVQMEKKRLNLSLFHKCQWARYRWNQKEVRT